MSRIVLSLAALLAAVAATAQITVFQPIDLEAGEPCDTMRYVVYYDLAFVEDTTDAADKPINEMTRLEVGDHVQYFYSNKSFQADSANAIVMKNGGNSYNGDGLIQWRLYKNYPAVGKTSLLEKFGMDRFVCTEDYAAPAWQPVADSSAESSAINAAWPWPRIRGAPGTHGMPRTYLSTRDRGNSADCPALSCGPTTRKSTTISPPPALSMPARRRLYIIKVESMSP